MFEIKRAYWPSFFMFVVIVLALLLSIDIFNYMLWFLSVSILFFLSLYYINKQIKFNPLTFLVAMFILLLIVSMVFIRPVENAEANYLIWLFAGGFLLFTYANKKFIRHTFYSLIGIFALLSVWGLIQYTTGAAYLINMGHRANSIFVTPNTFAASINIILLPTIVLYLLYVKNSRLLLCSLLILFSALLVTQSRGGWIAFISSMILISILLKVLSVKFDRLRLKNIIIGLTIVFVAYSVTNHFEHNNLNSKKSINSEINYLIRSESLVSTMSQRLELYDIAWQRIKQKPLLGYGLHTYQYYKSQAHKGSSVTDITRYVHNDYLQLWMETGVAGLLLFIALFLVLLYLLLKLSNKVSDKEKLLMLAIITSVTSFYVHALVDFIFYTPFLLLIFACSLGLFNQIVNKYFNMKEISLSLRYIRLNLLKLLSGLIIIFILAQPAIAQLVYKEAIRRTDHLDIVGALPYFELARRFAPNEPEYYWYEGAIFMNAVKSSRHKPSAKFVDELFEKGMAVSPYDVKNRLARSELHRDYGDVLDKPEDLNTVLSWNEEALYWQPNDDVVRSEYLKTLMAMGNFNGANSLLERYIFQSPDSEKLREIKEILQNNE